MADEARTRELVVQHVLESVRALSDAFDRMYGGMKGEMAMNATDLAALRMLIVREQRGEAVSPRALADHLRISTASTTKLLDRLVDSGLVERRPHPLDRRSRVLVLTDRARETFFTHFRGRMADMRGATDGYADADLAVVARFLDDLAMTIER